MKLASIVLCAGSGTRMKSSKSKMIHDICGRPLAYWSIKNALDLEGGIPIIVLSHQAERVKETLSLYFPEQLEFAYQPVPNGTGGAVKVALDHLNPECSDVLVLYGDTPLIELSSLERLKALHEKSGAVVSMVTSCTEQPHGYGRIVRDNSGNIITIVEEYAANSEQKEITEVNAGIYIVKKDFLLQAMGKINNNNSKKEYGFTDCIDLARTEFPHIPIANIEIPYQEMHGVNDQVQRAYAAQVLNQRMVTKWMLAGVIVHHPQSTYIEESVELSEDVVLFPNVSLRGSTKIEPGVVIENGSIITDTFIETNAHIFAYSCCDQASIGPNAQIGPFARLRPETRLDNDVKIGNFVEVKKSHIKKGSKANHLAYIGNADVGESCNIGAGSITCNYDGKNKHKTVIGNNAFIGSNSTLIAPITIGDGAYVAGGSTVNKEVPKDMLAFGRARQITVSKKMMR